MAITGVGLQPQGIMFIGSNQPDLDTLTRPTNPGAFFGMAWLDVNTGTLDQQSLFGGMPNQWGHFQAAINAAVTQGDDIDYRAYVTSFDIDGFTLNVTNAPSGFRFVSYIAFGEFDGANGACVGHDTHVFALPYRPWTGIEFHMYNSDGARNGGNNNAYYFTMGSANWPEEIDLPNEDNKTHGGSGVHRILTNRYWGYSDTILDFLSNTTMPTLASGPAQSYIDNYDHYYPQPGWPTGPAEGIRFEGYADAGRVSGMFWQGEGHLRFQGPVPNLGATKTITAPEHVPTIEAVLFYGLPNYDNATGSSNPAAAYSFGMITEQHQACITWDSFLGDHGFTGTGPGFFQSMQYCYADNLFGAGPRVQSGEIIGNQIVCTGEIQGTSHQGGSSLMQMWGDAPEVPGFFRVLGKG